MKMNMDMYKLLLKNCKLKEQVKMLVRDAYKDETNLSDEEFDDFIYAYVVPKLKELGVDFSNGISYEIILDERY